MIVALWILLALVVTGIVLYIHHRITEKGGEAGQAEAQPGSDRPEGCCGQHLVCEKESLLAAVSKEIVYYEDEELDAYRGMKADEYTDEQIEQFRDVLYTLRPEEIGGWARSIQLRQIELPSVVRDELVMLAAEARESHNSNSVANA